MLINRFDVYLLSLDPAIENEINKTRPCIVISPDEMNRFISTVIIAPISKKLRDYPTRVDYELQGKKGQISLDQIRTVDKSRLIQKLAELDLDIQNKVLIILTEMFSP